jgi:hypothetical protein
MEFHTANLYQPRFYEHKAYKNSKNCMMVIIETWHLFLTDQEAKAESGNDKCSLQETFIPKVIKTFEKRMKKL